MVFGMGQRIQEQIDKPETPVEETVVDEVVEGGEVETQEVETQEPEYSPLTKQVRALGYDVADDSAASYVLSQLNQEIIHYRRQSQQQPAQQTPAQPAPQPESFFPTYDESWSQYREDNGTLRAETPHDIRQKYEKWRTFETERLRNPEKHYMQVLEKMLERDEIVSKLAPRLQTHFDQQITAREQAREAEAIWHELENSLYQTNANGQPIVGYDGQPALSEFGQNVLSSTQAEMQRNGLDPFDQKNATHFAKVAKHYATQLKPQQAPVKTQQPKTPTVEEAVQIARENSRKEVVTANRLQSLQDPGGERNGNVRTELPNRPHPNNRASTIPTIRERMLEANGAN